MLGAIGLDEGQESAYRALVALGAAEVSELARRLALPETEMERALRRLEQHGLAAQSSARTGRWVAAPPGVALGALLTEQRNQLERAELAAAMLARQFRAEATTPAVHDLVEVVTGGSAVTHRFAQLRLGAVNEVCALVTDVHQIPADAEHPCGPDRDDGLHRIAGPGVDQTAGPKAGHGVRHDKVVPHGSACGEDTAGHPPSSSSAAPSAGPGWSCEAPVEGEAEAAAEDLVDGEEGLAPPCGFSHRMVVAREALSAAGGVARVTSALARGERIRVADEVPTRLVIADRAVAMVPLTAHGGDPAALVVHGSGLLESLSCLFEAVWREALPLRLGVGATAGGFEEATAGPDVTDLEILSLLLAGMTDARVAKQLDLGLRTVQRRVKGLMELTGVATRLQLGWHAYAKGWVARDLGE
ncbi:helix-turn-helix domain-containing protein [Streptomyces albipurpureus]|uniref:Helix-turn-helix transcriptional regulator n=1 Tax=Streptomyces albipurpureus TaxID=2897419 RepID=A0ABT0UHN6_9ACTN|nr:LuxR family transcriptional regulator [Streptomyces sp. CWNU-1]MCM2386978.1 helix-turn-helix transcriptional regulator [Streptomyces sp. CWNU-1]